MDWREMTDTVFSFIISFVCPFNSILSVSCSVVPDSVSPWTAARQASLSIANSWILLKLMSIELVGPSSHLILSSPSPPSSNLSQHQGLFKRVSSSRLSQDTWSELPTILQRISTGIYFTYCVCFHAQVAVVVKNLSANAGDVRDVWVRSLVRMSPWKRAWQPTTVFLPGESHGQRSLEGYWSIGLQRVGHSGSHLA